MAWLGEPVLIEEPLFKSPRGIVDQSLHARMGAEPTNGDGFGLGWYGAGEGPGVYHSISPAWSDSHLREIAAHIESHLFFAHIRAAIGSPVQQTNCHPFRHGRWLFMHNGFIDGFAKIKRDLALAVDESLFADIEGQTDTEMLFNVALTFGLRDDPPGAVSRAIGLVEELGERRGVTYPFQGTIATTDGQRTWVFRYSSEGRSRSLFFTSSVPELRRLYPDHETREGLPDDARLVVSEPLGPLPGVWNEVPESSYGIVGAGHDELLPFVVERPSRGVAL